MSVEENVSYIDLSELSAGTYLLRMKSRNGSIYTEKIFLTK